jgi:hypothetical protein
MRLSAVTPLLVVAVAAAGCGATKRIVVNVRTTPARAIVVDGPTTTISNVQTGMRIRCRGWRQSVKVPPPGSTANAGEGKATPNGTSSSKNMQLTHLANGSITVSCTASH